MRKIITVLLIFVLLLVPVSLISCEEQPDLPPREIRTASGHNCYVYGDILYYLTDAGQLYRYELPSFERISACMDPECDGNCLLHAVSQIYSVQNGKLFFTATSLDYEYNELNVLIKRTENIHYACMDIVTGEITVLRTQSGMEIDDVYREGMLFTDTHMYYMVNLLKEGGDPLKSEDYVRTYCRIPVSGGKEEMLFPAQSQSAEHAFGIRNEELIVSCEDIICAYNIETGVFREIFNYENSEFQMRPTRSCFRDGKLYFLGKVGRIMSENKERSYDSYALVELDLDTGAYRKIIDEGVFGYYLDESGIYYAKVDLRDIPMPQFGEDFVVRAMSSAEIYHCDYNGENEEVIYRNEGMYLFRPEFIVLDEYLYVYIVYEDTINYDEQAEEYRQSFAFRQINQKTGEIRKAIETAS